MATSHSQDACSLLICCHLRQQRDGLGPSEHHAKTSHERPKQHSTTAESLSLMSFLIVVALRSARLVRRRLYLVVVVLVDHLRERQEETQPANNHARTSCRCLAAPRPACETIRLMRFWSMRALRSAWLVRRRTHLEAKHERHLSREEKEP